MKKILVVLTGGTIGSYSDNGIISLKQNSCRAIELYQQSFHTDTLFTIVQPLHILSENLDKSHWEILVNYLYDTNTNDFDGIIITHGSDTLSYTSAMMGLCLAHFPIPVVITAANYIPDDPRSNAVENIRSAAAVIEHFQHGIFTVYQNDGDNFCSVYISTRIMEADRLFGKFSSFDGMPFGKVTNGIFQQLCPNPYSDNTNPIPFITNKKLLLQNDVLMVKPYPSMMYSAVSIPDTVQAVLHITYHSCTAKTDGSENALFLLQQCRQKNIPFYITAVKNSSVYQTSHLLLQNGAVPIYNLSNETSFAVLLLLHNGYLPPKMPSIIDC